ncbi:hypothetical protein PR001_g7408 [Phytophthora rubi]|uniref:Reverse transcriptase RNase H-like domain-containing protein n=1 Tax=Phytophthora rubi TaxID=129364 RepID=A0A6A3N7Q9_9STRA|nr:hypothetical protein PR001_g7408 [Phytophthora rubi]
MNVQRPRDIHDIRSFLGLTSYFRRKIRGYALISTPLERLKAKDAPFLWTEDCEIAFRQLKRALVKPPILVYPDMMKRFKLYVDSSRYAVGACLMQEVEGRNRVVAYASKLLTGSKKNWIINQNGISEIECWGIVWATRKFRCYLDKREFDLYTDHQALTWVFSPGNRSRNAKLARWAMELSNLQFKVFHKPGTTMGHVDGLSRSPMTTVNALTMADLLNPAEGGACDSVGEPSDPGVVPSSLSNGPDHDRDTREEVLDESPPLADDEVPADQPTSNVDLFGLDLEQFKAEQRKISWVVALITFIEDGALPLDPNLRVRVMRMDPKCGEWITDATSESTRESRTRTDTNRSGGPSTLRRDRLTLLPC